MSEPLTLGIDPSIAKTGICVLRGTDLLHAETLKTAVGNTDEDRVGQLAWYVSDLIDTYRVDAVGVEKQHAGGCLGNSLVKLCMAAGAMIGAVSLLDIPVYGIQPSEARKHIGGEGRKGGAMKKAEVQAVVMELLGLEKPLPQDQADAAAVALTATARHLTTLAREAEEAKA